MIQACRHRYSLQWLCRCLGISRHYFYYQCKKNAYQRRLKYAQQILTIFNGSYQSYGTRRIRQALLTEGISVSRRYVAKVMKSLSLKSKYTQKCYKNNNKNVNSVTINNVLQRNFTVGMKATVIVADLTYIKVGKKWNYLCVLLDLSARKIAGYRVGQHKTAELVMSALSQIKAPLSSIALFHSDRGKEFDNQLLDGCFDLFGITRSLSNKGCPYDNAVSEATFKTIKTEFVKNTTFSNTRELQQRFSAYAYWYNYKRLHSSLGYMTPVAFNKQLPLNLVV
ncbi:IS3 family transposase [Orbus mooreae]|uniref:IS3 family transposase n=1 Tax=Orbus mooreae TaxID=3074107 RepID=UPI00370D0045